MDENKKPFKKQLSEQLPSHSPDPGTWQNLVSRLDAMDAEVAFQQKLEELPVHSPNTGTWSIINSRLNRIGYFKTAVRVAMSVAAGLLLFFTVSKITENYRQTPSVASLSQQQHTNNKSAATSISNTFTAQKIKYGSETKDTKANSSVKIKTGNSASLKQGLYEVPDATAAVTEIPENYIELAVDVPLPGENIPEPIAQNSFIHEVSQPANELTQNSSESEVSILLKDRQNNTTSPPVKYYTPKDPKTGGNTNHFALAMNYLPENIENGTNTSLFHNVDLTASYNKEKVRYNTSLGMAYNEEQLVFEMNYDIKTPMTAPGPGGQVDTVGYNVSKMESQYQGTEKHQYITYNLGLARRLFSTGKFSTWISAGAGFGIQLNNPDLIAETAKSIKGQYNVQVTNPNTDQPVYNDVNVNFVTGLDLNYRILKKLSITFTPTSRWYFKPVITKNNQPTDELTLGFKTGMKFDF